MLRLLEVVKALLTFTWSLLISDVNCLEPLRKTVLVYEKLVILFRIWISSSPFSEVKVRVIKYQLVILIRYNLTFLSASHFICDRNLEGLL